MTAGSIKIIVTLPNRPGTLTSLASVLKTHRARVTHMTYHGARRSGTAGVSMPAAFPIEISQFLEDLHKGGYLYEVNWLDTE